MRKLSFLLSVVVLCACAASSRCADETSQDIAAPLKINGSASIDAPTLNTKVSFEARRLSLSELLAILSKQSGVRLVAEPDVRADVRVSARVDNLPLSIVMASLSRLYGVEWTKQGDTYTMRRSTLGPLHEKLLTVGATARTENQAESKERDERLELLAAEVMDTVGLEALSKRGGVAVASLPADLQQRLRDWYELPNAQDLVTNRIQMDEILKRDLSLHLQKSGETASFITQPYQGGIRELYAPSTLALTVRIATGQIVDRVFRSFPVQPPSESDKIREQLMNTTDGATALALGDKLVEALQREAAQRDAPQAEAAP